jgi:quercetin dioxygenase-like cupin family protein
MAKRRKNKWQKIADADLGTLQRFMTGEGSDDATVGREPGPAESPFPPHRGYRIEGWTQPFPPNPALLRHTMVTEGYTVFQWGDVPGSIYATHMHDTDQSHWMISGTLELIVAGCGTVTLAAGDRDFMPAGTYHSARVLGDEPAVYLVGERTG